MLVRGWFARTLSTSPPSLVRSCHGAYCGHSSASRKGSGTLQTYQKAAWKAFMVTRSPSSQLLFTACLLHFEWIFGGHIMFPNFPCGWKKYSNPKRYGRIQVSSFISTLEIGLWPDGLVCCGCNLSTKVWVLESGFHPMSFVFFLHRHWNNVLCH